MTDSLCLNLDKSPAFRPCLVEQFIACSAHVHDRALIIKRRKLPFVFVLGGLVQHAVNRCAIFRCKPRRLQANAAAKLKKRAVLGFQYPRNFLHPNRATCWRSFCGFAARDQASLTHSLAHQRMLEPKFKYNCKYASNRERNCHDAAAELHT